VRLLVLILPLFCIYGFQAALRAQGSLPFAEKCTYRSGEHNTTSAAGAGRVRPDGDNAPRPDEAAGECPGNITGWVEQLPCYCPCCWCPPACAPAAAGAPATAAASAAAGASAAAADALAATGAPAAATAPAAPARALLLVLPLLLIVHLLLLPLLLIVPLLLLPYFSVLVML